MAGWACPAWQGGISPCSRGRLGPSVLTGPAVPIQDTALLHTLPAWEPLAPLETWEHHYKSGGQTSTDWLPCRAGGL